MSTFPTVLSKRKALLGGVALTVLIATIVTINIAPSSHPKMEGDIPLPFAQQHSSLKGDLTFSGTRSGGISVYDVTFNHGEASVHLAPDTIYLVHIPNGDSIADGPLDGALTLSNGGHLVDYYGYRYSDTSATLEKRDINAIRFKDRFSGQFFLSQTGRANDSSHGNALSSFETVNNIVFLKTDSTPGAVRLDPAGALYVFVVNSEGGADLSIRRTVGCGNAIVESGEQCDDGNKNDTDGCSNDCEVVTPIPFDGEQSVGSTAVCGNGTLDSGEACDDRNTANGDGCSSLCVVESKFICNDASPSVCTCNVAMACLAPESGCHYEGSSCGYCGQQVCESPAPSVCGNGAKEGDEQCDSGSANGQVCTAAAGEVCTYCSSTCANVIVEGDPAPTVSTCGDGTLDQGEVCDDHNTTSGDGCSVTCTVEANFSCTKDSPSVCISYNDFVKALADTNHNGTVSDSEALLVTLDLADAPGQPYDTVKKYDINADGVVDNADFSAISTELEVLAPQS